MTSDNLLKFLGNRAYLHQVSYQEIKSMVVQYPYSLSLRYLLAMKSQQEDNTDLDRNIEMLATYGIDRVHLHKIFREEPIVLEDLGEAIVMGEDYLELKELSTLEREMENNLVENELNSISFLEEKLPTPSTDIPTDVDEVDLLTPSDIIDAKIEAHEIVQTEIDEAGIEANEIVETEIIAAENETEVNESILEEIATASAIVGGATLLNQDESTSEPSTSETPKENLLQDASNIVEPIIDKETEDYYTIDFEEDSLEEIGMPPISSDELAPSESFSAQDFEIDENGLPTDAVEVNDPYIETKALEEEKINDLFDEVEAEILAEKAVSDSEVYLDNPEELLVAESEKILANNLESTSDEVAKSPIAPKEEMEIEESEKIREFVKPKPQIPFEISYSEEDPVAQEEATAPSTATNDIPLDEVVSPLKEVPTEIEETVNVPTSKISPEPAENFQFDSLNELEANLQKEKSTPSNGPVPKSGFSSWQAQTSGVGPLSGINLTAFNRAKGKVVRKKKKIVQKQFEKTVAFAEESLTMTGDIASETLAQLLVNQGQYSKAKTMYEELCLIIPEKSSFFAGEIEKIQNLPDEPS